VQAVTEAPFFLSEAIAALQQDSTLTTEKKKPQSGSHILRLRDVRTKAKVIDLIQKCQERFSAQEVEVLDGDFRCAIEC